MVAKCIVDTHITDELTAYSLACFTCVYSNVEFICNRTYICNVTGIFLRGICH